MTINDVINTLLDPSSFVFSFPSFSSFFLLALLFLLQNFFDLRCFARGGDPLVRFLIASAAARFLPIPLRESPHTARSHASPCFPNREGLRGYIAPRCDRNQLRGPYRQARRESEYYRRNTQPRNVLRLSSPLLCWYALFFSSHRDCVFSRSHLLYGA